jgi:hypothetical protein
MRSAKAGQALGNILLPIGRGSLIYRNLIKIRDALRPECSGDIIG